MCAALSSPAGTWLTNSQKLTANPAEKCGPGGTSAASLTLGAPRAARCCATASSRRSLSSDCVSSRTARPTNRVGSRRMLTCCEVCSTTGSTLLTPSRRATSIAAATAAAENASLDMGFLKSCRPHKIYARGTRVRPNRGADLQPNSGARPVYPVAIETQPRMTNSASVPIPRSAAQLTSTAIPYFRSNRGSISCSMSAPPENRGARHLCQMAEQTGTQPRVRHWPEGKEAWERCAGPLSGADRTCVSGLSTAGHDPKRTKSWSRNVRDPVSAYLVISRLRGI